MLGTSPRLIMDRRVRSSILRITAVSCTVANTLPLSSTASASAPLRRSFTMPSLSTWKKERGSLTLVLARDDALVFGDIEGRHLHPERFSRTFREHLARCAKALGESAPPMIRLHDLRHTHASLLLADGEPVKTVSERLGHASATVTMTVYAHAMPGDQKRAASRFAALANQA